MPEITGGDLQYLRDMASVADSTGMVGSTRSCGATVWEISKSTVSVILKPASAIRAKIVSAESLGSGTRRSGDTREWLERPAKNCRRGPPAQLETPTAPANWMLLVGSISTVRRVGRCGHTSHQRTPCAPMRMDAGPQQSRRLHY